MSSDKRISDYKNKQLQEGQREFPCGILHDSIEEAMVHAEYNLGFRNSAGQLVAVLEPLLGSMYGDGTIVGWKVGSRKRFRVDFEPEYDAKNTEAAKTKNGVNKGTYGIHVNEEDFERTLKPKICHPTKSPFAWPTSFGGDGQVGMVGAGALPRQTSREWMADTAPLIHNAL